VSGHMGRTQPRRPGVIVGDEGRQGGTLPPGGEQGEEGNGAEVRVSRERCIGLSLEGVVQRFESRLRPGAVRGMGQEKKGRVQASRGGGGKRDEKEGIWPK
jgi:hypothetical protein